MSNMMAVFLNGEALIEYDRSKSLTEGQQAYLERMDKQMDQGITSADQSIPHPDSQQRAQFVALNLINALRTDDEARIAATCAYLANRHPDFKQVRADINQDNGAVLIDLVTDQEYVNQVKVGFDA